MNILYSIRLKKIVIMDVVIIALGFVFRVMAGFYCLNYELSNWVLICTFFLSAFIAFSKRRYEIMFDGSSVQFTRGYSPYLLDLLVLMSAGSAISSYVFYVLSRGNWQIGVPLLLSILPVFYGVVRYVMVIHRSEEKLDHTQLILSDKPLLISVLIWIALCIIEIYYIRANMTL
jgi:4-hydroxybenzoate polyprenyltransferase